ncbi:hypothetical protein OTT_1452 [Orientia tsutsugamushi str. Ikeda]|uniref:OmpA-like autotransporter n=1 Tax=Orientia tsutsugamushi (strain Ikeda) TaxID=334380 RepID=B3CU63_ORITI|nr:hypothetical protein [Orientia tsutsugamushi]BAG40910.1 hypothetical protein OTT_1452 [Orientia tsutsugamushi str. Ikeda]
MSILKSLLQPCYAVILAFVVLSSPSICTANNNVNFNTSKVSIDTSQFYLKLSSGINTDYGTLEAGIGYRQARHRMDVRLGLICSNYSIYDFAQGNYYYNIIEGNKASIFITGGLLLSLSGCLAINVDLGVGTTINLLRDIYLDIECSTMNYRPLPIHTRFGLRFHL